MNEVTKLSDRQFFAPKPLCVILSAVFFSILTACGGGGGGGSTTSSSAGGSTSLAGVGSGGTGFVTGFGSVIVDGIRYDDSKLDRNIELESEDSSLVAGARSDIKIGQRTEIEFETGDVATKLTLVSEIVGPVTEVAGGRSEIKVARQRVLTNTDSTQGPITIFDGVTTLSALSLNDRVEVHGLIKTDVTGAYIQASRIEVKPSLTSTGSAITKVKASGIVKSLATSGTNKVFTLGDLNVTVPATATVTPSGTVIAEGDRVKVYSSAGLSGASLTADAIKVLKQTQSRSEIRLVGVVNTVNSGAKTFKIDATSVDASAITSLPVNGQTVRVKGSFDATTGIVKATEVKASDDSITSSELKGSITDFVSSSSFKVRGVPVDASGVSVSGGVLALGVYVEIKGVVQNGVVKATSIELKSASEGSELSLNGKIVSFDLTAKTLTIGSQKISFSSSTTFEDGSTSDFALDKVLEVEGVLSGSTLLARKVSFEKVSAELEVEGVVAADASQSGSTIRFTVNQTALQCDSNDSTITNCSTAALKKGVKVNAKYISSGSANLVTRLRTKS